MVGSFFSDAPAEHSGSAYVYRRVGATWTEEAKLVAVDGAAGDLFGTSVAISGDALVVGARDRDVMAPNSGAVYVFRFDGTSWIQEAELSASDGAENDFLGVRVAIDGDVVVAGALTADAGRHDSGAAYVFRFDGTSWTQAAKLTASDGKAGDQFGNSVGISGDTVVVAAARAGRGVDRGAPTPGHRRCWRRSCAPGPVYALPHAPRAGGYAPGRTPVRIDPDPGRQPSPEPPMVTEVAHQRGARRPLYAR